jgi:hypothetical protein
LDRLYLQVVTEPQFKTKSQSGPAAQICGFARAQDAGDAPHWSARQILKPPLMSVHLSARLVDGVRDVVVHHPPCADGVLEVFSTYCLRCLSARTKEKLQRSLNI